MATTDVTSDATVYPSENQIETVQYAGSRGQESTHTDYFEAVTGDHIESGFTIPATHGDLDIPVAAGVAYILGHRIETDSSNDLSLSPSNTNYLYLQILLTSDKVVTVNLVSNVTGTAPSNSVLLASAVTGAASVTSSIDRRNADPYRLNSVTGLSLNLLGAKSKPGGVALNSGAGFSTLVANNFAVPYFRGREADMFLLYTAEVVYVTSAPGSQGAMNLRFRNGTTVVSSIIEHIDFGVTGVTSPSNRIITTGWLFEALDPGLAHNLNLQGSYLATGVGGSATLQNQVALWLEVGAAVDPFA